MISEKKEIISMKNAQELKVCFKKNSTKEAIEKFKQCLQNYRAIPAV